MKRNKIRQSAKGENCALRIPGVCNGDCSTTVLCHAPYPGRGGMRDHDFFAAYGCSDCHDLIDSRAASKIWHRINDTPESAWLRGIHETQMKLIAKGLM